MFEAIRNPTSGKVTVVDVPITYDVFNINTVGSAMDLSTGIFTAPRNGVYKFKGNDDKFIHYFN